MSEFSSASSEPPAPVAEPALEPVATAAPTPRRTAGLPPWLPYFLIAAVPALIVGLAVYLTAGGGSGGDGSDAAVIVDGLFRLGGDDVQSFQRELPPGLPSELPSYPGAKLVVSFLINSNQGVSYFVVYQTSDDPKKVLSYFQEKLDIEPWQVESGISSPELNGVFFSRPDDADVEGTVRVTTSELGRKATIYLSFDDVSPSSSAQPAAKPFELPATLGLPAGFPSDVPIFEGKNKSTVTAVQFQRGAGNILYLVTFLTKTSDVDVIDFYRKEFQQRGWQVTDGKPQSARDFALVLDFQDGSRQQLSGTIRADAFEDDATLTRVDLQLQVSTTRGRGN